MQQRPAQFKTRQKLNSKEMSVKYWLEQSVDDRNSLSCFRLMLSTCIRTHWLWFSVSNPAQIPTTRQVENQTTQARVVTTYGPTDGGPSTVKQPLSEFYTFHFILFRAPPAAHLHGGCSTCSVTVRGPFLQVSHARGPVSPAIPKIRCSGITKNAQNRKRSKQHHFDSKLGFPIPSTPPTRVECRSFGSGASPWLKFCFCACPSHGSVFFDAAEIGAAWTLSFLCFCSLQVRLHDRQLPHRRFRLRHHRRWVPPTQCDALSHV